MQKIRVELGERSYNIMISSEMLKDIGGIFEKFKFSNKAALISNPTVYALYGKTVSESLRASGCDLTEVILPDGEEYKSLASTEKIYEALLKAKLDRNSALIALGGGVIGDITGFAASTYMRGVDFIQVPTTLLAQVDSSVGGKTGVNHTLGKNMIGTFWQPRLVWVDISTLHSLSRRNFLAGIAEIVKYGIIRDPEFFAWLEQNMDRLLAREPEALSHAIYRSCRNKAEVVAADERESGGRALLNLGHTFGHAIEAGLGYGTWLHGEAVAAGTVLAADLSRRLGWLCEADVARIRALFTRARLPDTAPDLGEAAYLRLMGLDKKVEGGRIRFVLLRRIGEAVLSADVPPETLSATLHGFVGHA